tara:strand:+ start:3246 stop:3788 length:543 start_codon:yes stop_codon:yes gene_type:complete
MENIDYSQPFTPKFKVFLQIDDPSLKKIYQPYVDTWNYNHQFTPPYTYVDSGFDLLTPNTISFIKNENKRGPVTQLVDLKVKAAVYTTGNPTMPCAYTLNVRSSIYKTKFRLANNVGIIDSGYRGNLMAAVDCWDDTQVMERYNRYFQICMPTLEPFVIEIVDSLNKTKRGQGGHGSTGK